MRYQSKFAVFGLPLLSIAVGPDLATQQGRGIARGIIAIGDIAVGIFAAGGAAFGVVSVGGLALGLFSLGGISIGLLALGGVAIGGIAIGGCALRYTCDWWPRHRILFPRWLGNRRPSARRQDAWVAILMQHHHGLDLVRSRPIHCSQLTHHSTRTGTIKPRQQLNSNVRPHPKIGALDIPFMIWT